MRQVRRPGEAHVSVTCRLQMATCAMCATAWRRSCRLQVTWRRAPSAPALRCVRVGYFDYIWRRAPSAPVWGGARVGYIGYRWRRAPSAPAGGGACVGYFGSDVRHARHLRGHPREPSVESHTWLTRRVTLRRRNRPREPQEHVSMLAWPMCRKGETDQVRRRAKCRPDT